MPIFSNSKLVASNKTSNSYTHEIAAADFNGDGKLDVVSGFFFYPLRDNAQNLNLLVGNGKGSFVNGTNLFTNSLPVTVHPRNFLIADFNGDGKPDLFIADHGYDTYPFPGAQNQLILSTPSNRLVNATGNLPQISDYTHSAAAADVDGDGDLDIFVGNLNGKKSILLNDGQGKFDQSIELQINSYTSSIFSDFNNDGKQDLFLGGWNSASLVLMGDGTGHFPNQVTLPLGSYGDSSTTVLDSKVIDLNKDGNSDLILASTKNYEESKIQILLGDGTGSFVDSTNLLFIQGWKNNSWIKYIHLADLNRDGAPDLITELSDGSKSTIFLNDGDGKFFEPKNNKLNLGALEVADFSGDNIPDVVYWNGSNLYFAAGTGKFDLNLVGTTKNDVLQGDGFKNKLSGSAGNDTLRGGSGNDTLIGGLGNDWLNGGSGSDRFVFDTNPSASNVDTIVNFGDGLDKIVLGKSIFKFTKDMVNKDGSLNLSAAKLSQYLGISNNSGTWSVTFDADGAGNKSQPIKFVDVTLIGTKTTLDFSDFIVG